MTLPRTSPVCGNAHTRRAILSQVLGACVGIGAADWLRGQEPAKGDDDGPTLPISAEQAKQAAAAAKRRGVPTLPFPELGKPFAFRVRDLHGHWVDSADFKDQVLLVDFWATWCPPCMRQLPEVRELVRAHHEQGLRVVGVNLDQSREKCLFAVRRLQWTWPIILAPTDPEPRKLWMKATGLTSLPRMLLLDRDGRLQVNGELDEVVKALKPLLRARR